MVVVKEFFHIFLLFLFARFWEINTSDRGDSSFRHKMWWRLSTWEETEPGLLDGRAFFIGTTIDI
jgi:hypothetical protein